MKYGEKFVYHKCQGPNKHEYTECKFICERPDKNTILIEYNYIFSRHYMEISNNDIDNLYDLDKLTKHFEERKIELREKIDFLNKFINNSPNHYEFDRHARIIIDLLYEKKLWEGELQRNKKNENEKEAYKSEKIINQINKGIKRHNKRLYKSLVGYENIELTKLYNANGRIKKMEEQIKDNNNTLKTLKKYMESK